MNINKVIVTAAPKQNTIKSGNVKKPNINCDFFEFAGIKKLSNPMSSYYFLFSDFFLIASPYSLIFSTNSLSIVLNISATFLALTVSLFSPFK